MPSSGYFRFVRLVGVLLLLGACAARTQEAAAERSWDDAPRLTNFAEARRAIAAEYPADLRRRGIGGQVTLWLFVSENGRVIRTSVLESSGHEALDLAAIAVAERMEFDPATKNGKPKGLWVRQAITFGVD